jgi:hypothetical protein
MWFVLTGLETALLDDVTELNDFNFGVTDSNDGLAFSLRDIALENV